MALFNLGGLYDRLGKPEINLELVKKSVDKGFRDIDAFRGSTFENPSHTQQMELLIRELEELIANEKAK
jgi:hypothetical protein